MSLPYTVEYDDVTLAGAPSLIVCQNFGDRVVLFVTQLPTFGTLVEAHSNLHLDGTESASVRILLGDSDSDIPSLCARVMLECMRAGRSPWERPGDQIWLSRQCQHLARGYCLRIASWKPFCG